ncbi:DUF5320 domain-containing protein [Clostridium sp. 'deep sea']|jgi:hypothetical protein|uniref:DUF5320 domain-containing protein n=1 Tax=Clostridium sp. 'deep sea' TaxID=2779445 RepID=UPI0018964C9A|nr:DUF5320 domain-containing protein [Clostridium sp. 'deep sea']QOR36706.1 DUF5320 domain-containing protein [Clostridium sp. 'deep sea']
MPRFDGTGPNGEGPKTGRNRGNCEGSVAYGFGRGRGCRGNRTRGLGFGRGYNSFNNNEQTLTERISSLENHLSQLKELNKEQKN